MFRIRQFMLYFPGKLQNITKHRQVFGFIRKNLYMFVNLRCSRLWSTIEKVKPSQCLKRIYALLKVLFIEWSWLMLKFFGYQKQMLLIDIILIEDKAMRRPKLLNKKTLNIRQSYFLERRQERVADLLFIVSLFLF